MQNTQAVRVVDLRIELQAVNFSLLHGKGRRHSAFGKCRGLYTLGQFQQIHPVQIPVGFHQAPEQRQIRKGQQRGFLLRLQAQIIAPKGAAKAAGRAAHCQNGPISRQNFRVYQFSAGGLTRQQNALALSAIQGAQSLPGTGNFAIHAVRAEHTRHRPGLIAAKIHNQYHIPCHGYPS